jgi:hypothetical protein
MIGLANIYNIIFITKEFLFVCDRDFKVSFDPCFTLFNDIEDILILYFVAHRHQKVLTIALGTPNGISLYPYRNDSCFCFRGTKGTLFEGGTRGAGFVSGGRLAQRWVQAHRSLRRTA